MNSYRISQKPVGGRDCSSTSSPQSSGGEQAGRAEDHERVDQQGQHGQLHLAGLDLLAEVLRRSADHQPGQEDADDQVDEQVDQADADAAEDAVEPHAGQRRQPGERVEAVVHAVDRAVRRDGRHRRPGRRRPTVPKRSSLPSRLPSRLVDRQAGEGRGGHVLGDRLAVLVEPGDCERLRRGGRGRSGRGSAGSVS